MINYVNGDLFENVPDTPVVIAHICNDKGGFGSGFVVPLSQHFPKSKMQYLAWHSSGLDFGRGRVQFVEDKNVVVANMVAQTLGGERPIYYNDLSRCMDKVAHYIIVNLKRTGQIICPMFGSGLAKGDWNIVEKLIEDCWIRRGISVTVHYLPQFLPNNWTLPKNNVHEFEKRP